MRTVLVTGANGFLGRYVTRHFAAQGWTVVGVGRGRPDRTMRRCMKLFCPWTLPDARFGDLLSEVRPALFVHAAGGASIAESIADSERDFANGPALVTVILQQLRMHSPHTRFVFLSSAAVYGNPSRLPVSEGDPTAPISPYGQHKRRSEELCRQFADEFQLRTASVRIFSAYGPGLRRQVVWDIFQKALSGNEVLLQGTGSETRDFLHAADVAIGIDLLFRRGEFAGETYNFASGRATSIAELAERIVCFMGASARIRFDGVLPPGTPRNWCASIDRLVTLGFAPTISLDTGLIETARWIQRARRRPAVAGAK